MSLASPSVCHYADVVLFLPFLEVLLVLLILCHQLLHNAFQLKTSMILLRETHAVLSLFQRR